MSGMPAFAAGIASMGAVVNAEDVNPSLHSQSFDDKHDKDFSNEKGDVTPYVLTEAQVGGAVVVNDGT